MTTLPSCMYWTFTNSGLLIQDWLLKPVRPVNLNEAINQLYLSSSVDYHQSNSHPPHHHHQLSNFNNNNNNNTLSNDKMQQILQIIFYFSLPLIPAATILFTIINIFIESKYYICPKYTLFTRPYIQRLSQYLIVFYVLTGINSSLIWLSILPRYIPMSIGNYITLTNSNNNNDYLINKQNSNLTNQYNSNLLINSSSSSSSYDSNITPKFITQLPAILTMQIVLRLTLCWLIIGIIIDRIYILGELYMNPMTKSFNYYINYLYTFIKDNINENYYYYHSVDNDNCLINKQNQKTAKCSMFQQVFKFFGAKLCSIQKCSIKSCPICKQINYNLENEYTCFVCKTNYLYNTNLLCHGDEKQHHQQQQSEENTYLNSSIIPNKTTQCTSIGRLILMTGLLVTCSLAICLPQVWSYQLIGINLKIKLSNNGNSKNFIEKIYPAWRLINRNSQTIYEYCFAAISFVIPCCTIIVCLLLLIMRLIKIKCEFQHIYLHGSNMKDIQFYKLYENIVKYCLTRLIQDCILVLIIAFIQLCCSLPHLMTNSINRLECLLVSSNKASSIPSTSSSPSSLSPQSSSASSSSSSVGAEATDASRTDNYWPTRQNWLLIELSCLFGDFLIQLVILSIRLCETNHLMTNVNFPFQNFENNWLKKCNINNNNNNSSMNKQNYTSVQCQHGVQQNDCDVEHLMKMQELNEDVNKGVDEESYESNRQIRQEDEDQDDDDDNDDDFHEVGDDIGNGNRQRTHVYPMKTPTDSGQTSKNISPLPISHTLSDVLLSPKFKPKQGVYRLNVQNKVHRSSPSTFTSPLLQRIPENINYQNNCHSFIGNNNTMTKPSVTAITKGLLNTYVEPKTNMASLTYSPRSRHPCRLQTRISDPLKSTQYNNINNRIHLSTLSSINPSKQITTTPNMNTTRLHQNRWIDNNSPPPLPPPPKHLMHMLGEDSSIYSTPHGSPQQFGTRKQMILNNSNNNNNACNNTTNLSVAYSPNLSRLTHISKHESPTAMSFRQTDSGVTGLGGSLIDSENYESNIVIT